MRAVLRASTARAARRLGVLAMAWAVCACATSGTPKPEIALERDAQGFTIREEVRVGAGVSDDFEEALRLLEAERFEDGIRLLVGVTEAAPNVTVPHIDLAIAYGRVGELERAEQSLLRALELNPRHPVAHNELGIVYRRTGRFEQARESYEKALAAHPDFHFARRNLAVLCDLYLADADCALAHYGQYAEAVPDDESVAMWMADLRNRVGR